MCGGVGEDEGDGGVEGGGEGGKKEERTGDRSN